MTTHIISAIEASTMQRIVRFLKRVYKLELLRSQIRTERNQLPELSDKELRDMGITREQAMHEARRAFNDIPQTRADMEL